MATCGGYGFTRDFIFGKQVHFIILSKSRSIIKVTQAAHKTDVILTHEEMTSSMAVDSSLNSSTTHMKLLNHRRNVREEARGRVPQ